MRTIWIAIMLVVAGCAVPATDKPSPMATTNSSIAEPSPITTANSSHIEPATSIVAEKQTSETIAQAPMQIERPEQPQHKLIILGIITLAIIGSIILYVRRARRK